MWISSERRIGNAKDLINVAPLSQIKTVGDDKVGQFGPD